MHAFASMADRAIPNLHRRFWHAALALLIATPAAIAPLPVRAQAFVGLARAEVVVGQADAQFVQPLAQPADHLGDGHGFLVQFEHDLPQPGHGLRDAFEGPQQVVVGQFRRMQVQEQACAGR